ncbi:hypothetical protein Tco_1163949 [Tanacetum coccineum]
MAMMMEHWIQKADQAILEDCSTRNSPKRRGKDSEKSELQLFILTVSLRHVLYKGNDKKKKDYTRAMTVSRRFLKPRDESCAKQGQTMMTINLTVSKSTFPLHGHNFPWH